MSEPAPLLTDQFFAAAALAIAVHGSQRRLGTQIPYAAHLMIVAGPVLEDGGDDTRRSPRCCATALRTAADERCSSASVPSWL